MSSSSSLCYLRRPGKTWEPAPVVYQRILDLYEELQGNRRSRQQDPVTICTSCPNGEVMMAQVSSKPHMRGVFVCEVVEAGDEAGTGTVELMRCSVALGVGEIKKRGG